MNNLNSILLEGNLQKAPVMQTTKKGNPFTSFPMVSNRYYKTEDETIDQEETKLNVYAYGKLAEAIVENGLKGRGIRVVGRVGNSPDGKSLVIIAEHCEFRPMPPAPEKKEKKKEAEQE
jgi:single-strand DNA-binding protein